MNTMKKVNHTENSYYIYAYIRTKDSPTAKAGTPYYIGKGKNKRAWNKKKQEKVPAPKDHSSIIVMESNLTEVGALALERRYIRWYGRKDLRTGILHNLTNGGDGTSGFRHTDESKKKLSDANKGNSYAKGNIMSDESKKKIGQAASGRTYPNRKRTKRVPLSDELKQKISKSKLGIGRGKIWINDGEKQTLVYPDNIPNGYVVGRLERKSDGWV